MKIRHSIPNINLHTDISQFNNVLEILRDMTCATLNFDSKLLYLNYIGKIQ